MVPKPITELVESFRSGALPRDDYWKAMQQHHRTLQDYARLIQSPDLDRIEIRASGVFVVFGSGVRMYWRPDDTRSVPSVTVNNGSYEPTERRLLESLAAGAQLILDIGANAGYMALHMARAVAPRSGKILAFEPVPSTYGELCANVAVNDLEETVSTINVALGDRDGSLAFYVPAFHGSVAASARPLFPNEENKHVQVRMVRLDDYAAEHPFSRIDLVKCDVEGAELLVLRGGLETLKRHRPILMLEMLRKWAAAYDYHPNDIIDLLRSLDYACWSYENGRFVEYTKMDDDCEQTNFFFMQPDKHAGVREMLEQRMAS